MVRFIRLLLMASAAVLAGFTNAKDYKGAEIFSNEAYLYGRYEIRMQVAKGSGVLSTFFTYKNGSEVGNTFWEEIDIEVFGKNDATEWQSNIILGSSRPTLFAEQDHTAARSLGDGYHTYVLEWTPDYVAWYLDGEEIRRITGTSTVTSLTTPQSLRFNIWSSDSVEWVGAWDDSILPVYQFVNYIDYQAYNLDTKTFEGGWRDDFDELDDRRWSKAEWTFDTNRVDFAPENVVIKNGILILALTTPTATGYSGTPPVDAASSASSMSSNPSNSAASSVESSVTSSVASSANNSVESSANNSVVSSVTSSGEASAASSTATSAAASSRAASSGSAVGGGSGSGGGGAVNRWWLVMLAWLWLIQLKPGQRANKTTR